MRALTSCETSYLLMRSKELMRPKRVAEIKKRRDVKNVLSLGRIQIDRTPDLVMRYWHEGLISYGSIVNRVKVCGSQRVTRCWSIDI